MAKITIVVDLPEHDVDDTRDLDPHEPALYLLTEAADSRRANGEGVLVFIGAEWGDYLPDVIGATPVVRAEEVP